MESASSCLGPGRGEGEGGGGGGGGGSGGGGGGIRPERVPRTAPPGGGGWARGWRGCRGAPARRRTLLPLLLAARVSAASAI